MGRVFWTILSSIAALSQAHLLSICTSTNPDEAGVLTFWYVTYHSQTTGVAGGAKISSLVTNKTLQVTFDDTSKFGVCGAKSTCQRFTGSNHVDQTGYGPANAPPCNAFDYIRDSCSQSPIVASTSAGYPTVNENTNIRCYGLGKELNQLFAIGNGTPEKYVYLPEIFNSSYNRGTDATTMTGKGTEWPWAHDSTNYHRIVNSFPVTFSAATTGGTPAVTGYYAMETENTNYILDPCSKYGTHLNSDAIQYHACNLGIDTAKSSNNMGRKMLVFVSVPASTPTPAPTPAPTAAPTPAPTPAPTESPTPSPTRTPTELGDTFAPTESPTAAPTTSPTDPTSAPTLAPTPAPTPAPTFPSCQDKWPTLGPGVEYVDTDSHCQGQVNGQECPTRCTDLSHIRSGHVTCESSGSYSNTATCGDTFIVNPPAVNPVHVFGDPHLIGPHGDRADFKGRNNTYYNMLSTNNLSIAVLFVHDTYNWRGKVVFGSWMKAIAVVAKSADGLTAEASYTCERPDSMEVNIEGTTDERVTVAAGSVIEHEKVKVSLDAKHVFTISNEEWAVEAKNSHLPYRSANAHKKRLDIKLSPLVDVNVNPVAPHGLLGQFYDRDDKMVVGALDDYDPFKHVMETTANAEGAIEGVAADYEIDRANPLSTKFKFSRFGLRQAAPRDVTLLSGKILQAEESNSVNAGAMNDEDHQDVEITEA